MVSHDDARDERPDGEGKPLEPLSWDEIMRRAEPERYAVHRLIPAQSVGVIWGNPGAFKSTLAVDIALSLVTSRPVLGLGVMPGAAVYVAAEGDRGICRRVKAWITGDDDPDADHALESTFWLYDRALDLGCLEDVAALVEDVQQRAERAGVDVAIVIIDTLSLCLSGADENDSGDVNTAALSMRLIARELDTAVVAIHHPRKDGDAERGSSALRAAADFMVRATGGEKDGRSFITITGEKSRDGKPLPATSAWIEGVWFDGEDPSRDPDSVRIGALRTIDPICRGRRLMERLIRRLPDDPSRPSVAPTVVPILGMVVLELHALGSASPSQISESFAEGGEFTRGRQAISKDVNALQRSGWVDSNGEQSKRRRYSLTEPITPLVDEFLAEETS